MADYIDREKAEKIIQSITIVDVTSAAYAEAVLFIIRNIPSADVAPVVHGEWLCAETDDEQFFLCSVCNDKEYWESNYCPECGALMQEEPINEKQHDAE